MHRGEVPREQFHVYVMLQLPRPVHVCVFVCAPAAIEEWLCSDAPCVWECVSLLL